MIEVFVAVFIGSLLGVSLHEFGHAYVAWRGGDYTVKGKGYLTLNPAKYMHPMLSIAMPLLFLLIGGIPLPGGAVYIEERLIRSKGWRTGVSLAGPGMSLLYALVLAVPFWLGLVPNDPQNVFSISLAFLVDLEIISALINLIPVPPLDGFGAIGHWFGEEFALRMRIKASNNMMLVMVAVYFGSSYLWTATFAISKFLNVDPYLAYCGQEAFFFWR